MTSMYGDSRITKNSSPSRNDTKPLPVEISVFFNVTVQPMRLTTASNTG